MRKLQVACVMRLCLLLLFMCACSPNYYKRRVDEGVKKEVEFEKIRKVEIDGVFAVQDGLHVAKDDETMIEVDTIEKLNLDDFMALLGGKGFNFVLKGISEENKQKDKLIYVPKYKGKLIDLLQGVQDTNNVFIDIKNKIITVKEEKNISVKVLNSGQAVAIENIVRALGAKECKYDVSQSRVVFKADYTAYKNIQQYFKNNSLYMAVINVVIVESEVSKSSKFGIDWQQLNAVYESGSKKSKVFNVIAGTGGDFIITGVDKALSIYSVLSSMEQFTKYDIIQNSVVSVVNGEVGKLDVSTKVPYVSQVNLSTVGVNDKGYSNTVYTYSFDVVDSGLLINVQPFIDSKVITLNCEIRYQSISNYVQVGTKENQITRPVVQARNIKTMATVEPGTVIMLGSLRYSAGSQKETGLYKMYKVGNSIEDQKIMEVSILMGVSVVEYKFN